MSVQRIRTKVLAAATALVLGGGLFAGLAPLASRASSHREAPLTAADPQIDNTDVYAFVSPDRPDSVTLVSSWIPFEEPAGGPNFYLWAEHTNYDINIEQRRRYQRRHHVPLEVHDALPQPEHVPLQHGSGHVAERPRPEHLPDVRPLEDRERSQEPPARTTRSWRRATWAPRPCRTTTATCSTTPPRSSADRTRPTAGSVNPTTRSSSTSACSTSCTGRTSPRPATTRCPGSTSTRSRCRCRRRTSPRAASRRSASGARHRVRACGSRTATARSRSRARSSRSRAWACPLVNEVVVPVGLKDYFNSSKPKADGAALPLVQDPELPHLLNAVYGTDIPDSDPDTAGIQRADLIQVFLTGCPDAEPARARQGQRDAAAEHGDRAVLERRARRLGVIGGDAGRASRTAVACPTTSSTSSLRVVLGVLLPDHQALADTIGDGVDANDVPFLNAVPLRGLPVLRVGHVAAQLIQRIREGSGPSGRTPPPTTERRGATEMKRVVRIGGAAALAAALFVAGGIGAVPFGRRRCGAGVGPGRAADVRGHVARARDRRLARSDDREPPVAAARAARPTGRRSHRSASRTCNRRASTADPSYYPKAQGVLAALARAGAGRQLRGHGGHGRARRRPARLRRRAAVGRAGEVRSTRTTATSTA